MVETAEQPPASAAGYLQYTILPSLWQVALRTRHLTHRAGRAIFLPPHSTGGPPAGGSDSSSVRDRWRLLMCPPGAPHSRAMESVSSREATPEQPSSQAAKRRTGPPRGRCSPDCAPGGALRLLRAVIAVRMFKSLSVLRLDTAHLQQYSINYGKFSAAGSPLACALCAIS